MGEALLSEFVTWTADGLASGELSGTERGQVSEGCRAPMIEMYRIELPSVDLEAMSTEERALLLLLGLVFNRITALVKIVHFSHNEHCVGAEPSRQIQAAQTTALTLLLFSALYEGWEIV